MGPSAGVGRASGGGHPGARALGGRLDGGGIACCRRGGGRSGPEGASALRPARRMCSLGALLKGCGRGRGAWRTGGGRRRRRPGVESAEESAWAGAHQISGAFPARGAARGALPPNCPLPVGGAHVRNVQRGQLSMAGWGARTARIHSPCALTRMLPTGVCTLPPSGSCTGQAAQLIHARTMGGDSLLLASRASMNSSGTLQERVMAVQAAAESR